MIIDPITEEIRTIRQALAALHGNDLGRIYEALRQSELSSGREFISLPRRPARTHATAGPSQPSVPAAGAVVGEPSPLPDR